MVGVCAVLWGKEGDEEENSDEEVFVEVVKRCKGCGNNSPSMPRIDEEVDVEMQSTVDAKTVVALLYVVSCVKKCSRA